MLLWVQMKTWRQEVSGQRKVLSMKETRHRGSVPVDSLPQGMSCRGALVPVLMDRILQWEQGGSGTSAGGQNSTAGNGPQGGGSGTNACEQNSTTGNGPQGGSGTSAGGQNSTAGHRGALVPVLVNRTLPQEMSIWRMMMYMYTMMGAIILMALLGQKQMFKQHLTLSFLGAIR